jgi:hypothetical protein
MKLTKPRIQEDDFYENINAAIKEGRHVDALEDIVKQYEDYKAVMEQALTDKNSSDAVYVFCAKYLRRKNIWREIAILGSQTFEILAGEIINSMAWDNDHMHGFSLPKKPQLQSPFSFSPLAEYYPYTFFADGWGDDQYPTFKSNQIRICQINYDLFPVLRFEFDFGDSHLFEVKLKEIRKPEIHGSKKTLPMLVDQRGVAPEQYPDYE